MIPQNTDTKKMWQVPMVSLPLALAMLVFVVSSWSPQVLADPDSYWHVAAGRWILAHGTVPTHDVFSFTMPGQPWTAHEWLAEVLMALAHRWAGFGGVTLLASACFALTAAVIFRALLARMEPVPAIAAAAVAVVGVYSHFLARPHVVVWPLMAIWVATLIDAAEQRRRPPWWLLAVLLVWTNAHASFTMGLALAGGIAVEALMVQRTAGATRTALRDWGPFLCAAGLVVLMNPAGIGAVSHALELMQMAPVLARIGEWRSADFQVFQLILFWFAAVLVLAFTGRLRLSPARLVMLLGLMYLALKHQRYHALLALVSPFLLAAPLAAGLAAASPVTAAPLAPQDPLVDRLDRWMAVHAQPSAWPAHVLVLLLLGSYAVTGRAWVTSEPLAARTPARALEAAQRAHVQGPLLNSYDFGGYLIYRGIPVFIDGRADMYGSPFVVAALDAAGLRTARAFEGALTHYGIGWTMLVPATPAVQLLDHLPGWCRVYADAVAVVHQHCTSADARSADARSADARSARAHVIDTGPVPTRAANDPQFAHRSQKIEGTHFRAGLMPPDRERLF